MPACPSGVRCPRGKCLLEEDVCDAQPECADFSDEDDSRCRSAQPKMCTPDPIDPTAKCMCNRNEFLCRSTGICLPSEQYCDGQDNCGDNSDEQPGCDTCLIYTKDQHPNKICDGSIDCLGKFDTGADEGANECCNNATLGLNSQLGEFPYRCVKGTLNSQTTFQDVALTGECINSRYVCDWNTSPTGSPGFDRCTNGVDEEKCFALWPRNRGSISGSRDAFGRYVTLNSGYLYFVAFGKKYLYCASRQIWKPQHRKRFAGAICQHQGFADVDRIALHNPTSRTKIGGSSFLLDEKERLHHYESCALVFISCRKHHGYIT